MESINFFLTILLCLYIIKLIIETIKCLKIDKIYDEDMERLKHGDLLLDDIYNLTPMEFKNWCADFLWKEGYSDISVSSKGLDGGKDIICKKGTDIYFVECKPYKYNKNAELKIDMNAAKELIGSMVGCNITNGVLITTGIFTEEALRYINTLPTNYNLQLYDGKDLVKKYETLMTLKACNQNPGDSPEF